MSELVNVYRAGSGCLPTGLSVYKRGSFRRPQVSLQLMLLPVQSTSAIALSRPQTQRLRAALQLTSMC